MTSQATRAPQVRVIEVEVGAAQAGSVSKPAKRAAILNQAHIDTDDWEKLKWLGPNDERHAQVFTSQQLFMPEAAH